MDFYIKSALSSLNLDGLETISGKSHFTDIGMEISYFDIMQKANALVPHIEILTKKDKNK